MKSNRTVPDAADQYAAGVGRCLRSVRMDAGISLREASARSGGLFSTALLGAYERHERNISMSRLQQLAELYEVPLDALLPKDPGVRPRAGSRRRRRTHSKVTIDTAKLYLVPNPQRRAIRNLTTFITAQRDDTGGTIISIRSEDARSIASLFDDAKVAVAILDELRPEES